MLFRSGSIGTGIIGIYTSVYNKIPTFANSSGNEINYNSVITIFKDVFIDGFILVLPIFAVVFVLAFLGDLVQVKWKVSSKPLQPKGSKINPLKGFKRIISMQSLVNFLKSLALVVIIMFVVFQTIITKRGVLFNLYEVSLLEAIGIIGDIVFDLAIKISAIYLIVGMADFIYQKIKFKNDMKMTKQEVKDEYKSSEGDPQIKGQIRQRMRQASMRRKIGRAHV